MKLIHLIIRTSFEFGRDFRFELKETLVWHSRHVAFFSKRLSTSKQDHTGLGFDALSLEVSPSAVLFEGENILSSIP